MHAGASLRLHAKAPQCSRAAEAAASFRMLAAAVALQRCFCASCAHIRNESVLNTRSRANFVKRAHPCAALVACLFGWNNNNLPFYPAAAAALLPNHLSPLESLLRLLLSLSSS